jgi:ribonuclease-3
VPYFQEEVKKIPSPPLLDPKSKLQALTQVHFQVLPEYRVVSRRGPSHDPSFSVEVRVGRKLLGTGAGRSKKEAEQAAAKAGLISWESKKGRIRE